MRRPRSTARELRFADDNSARGRGRAATTKRRRVNRASRRCLFVLRRTRLTCDNGGSTTFFDDCGATIAHTALLHSNAAHAVAQRDRKGITAVCIV